MNSNSKKLNAMMASQKWSEADVAQMLNFKPSNRTDWSGHKTVRKMRQLDGYTPMIGWENIFTILQKYCK